ncbi:fibrocystin-L-like [Argopecten irradians]|uniref:fibrocystin-L-like n=1 Tax=Argopecten irradians TaxID=31199 RepID=UPI00371DAA0A
MATDTFIACNVTDVPSGEYKPIVEVNGKGFAKFDSNTTVIFSSKIFNLSPSSSGLGGNVAITISGIGFSRNFSVTIGAKTCGILTVSTTRIVCLAPATKIGGEVSVTLEQPSEELITAGVQFV